MAQIDTFSTGSETVGTTAVNLPSKSCQTGVWVVSDPGNTGTIYVGSASTVTGNGTDATDGFALAAGGSIFLPVVNADAVWVISDLAAQEVGFLVI